MKANELRIGNWINTFQEEQAVDVLCDSVSTMTHQCLPYDMVSGIPLTEEWLLKFGFPWEIKYQANGNDDFWGLFSECYPTNKGYNLIMKKDKFLLVPEIKHVHQLQNLYFALTGEELEPKQV